MPLIQSDGDWLLEQVQGWSVLGLAELLQSLGSPGAVAPPDQDLHVLVPLNPRLHRVVVRTLEGRVRLIGLNGPPFAVPLPVVQALTTGFRRAFNTYDPIDDEQFFFYPAHSSLPFAAVESWVTPDQQRANSQQVMLSKLTFHFGADQVPFLFRDGWHLAPVPPRAAPTPPTYNVGTALKRLFRLN